MVAEARSSSRRPAEWFRSRQESYLRRLLVHAYENVPLYRKLYDEVGFRPERFRSLDDLQQIPPLSKSRLKGASIEDILARGIDPASCQWVATSGSTGVPLQILLGRFERCWHRAVAWRILFENGFRWTDRTLEIRMTLGPVHWLQQMGIAPKDWFSILQPPEDWVSILNRRHHSCIIAGAGTLDRFAGAMTGHSRHRPKLVFSDSEPLTPQARTRIRHAFGVDPVDVYGMVEASNFAWQCEERQGFHVSADSHVVEVDAATGESGPLLVTALGMWSMPIIRYETGDLAAWATNLCRCGRTLPVLATIHGRAIDSILLGDGRQLLWPFFHEILGRFSQVIEWQVCQTGPLMLVVRVVLRDQQRENLSKVDAALREQLPPKVSLRVDSVTAIATGANGKRRLVIPLGDASVNPGEGALEKP